MDMIKTMMIIGLLTATSLFPATSFSMGKLSVPVMVRVYNMAQFDKNEKIISSTFAYMKNKIIYY